MTEYQRILDLQFYSKDLARTLTVRDYLVRLLATLWADGEDFNPRRPFGSSGWRTDLEKLLYKEGIVFGTFDEKNGLLLKSDTLVFNRIMLNVIKAMGSKADQKK